MYTSSRLPIVSKKLKHGETARETFALAEILETRHFSILPREKGGSGGPPPEILEKITSQNSIFTHFRLNVFHFLLLIFPKNST